MHNNAFRNGMAADRGESEAKDYQGSGSLDDSRLLGSDDDGSFF